MLDANLKTQLKAYFERIVHPIELVATLDDGAASATMLHLLTEIVSLSDRITLSTRGEGARVPSFEIRRTGARDGVCFAGAPMGHEFNSLVLALLWVGGHAPKEEAATITRIRALRGPLRFETFYSQSCQNCPEVVQALMLAAALNPTVEHVAVDGGVFADEVEARGILAVPAVFLNGEPFAQGRMSLDQILTKLDDGAATEQASVVHEPFDVLVVGGGPAGAAAAIYAARKGIRTGLVAERFGGQVQDTMAIENLIAVAHIDGPHLAAGLEQTVRANGVEVMTGRAAAALTPAPAAGELASVTLSGGAVLRARTVVLAPGARWRTMDVPGEAEYRNKGVAFCPHCDGPLFRGKRVAVIGGGNSGVEAAIDLAGLTAHVTLVEFDRQLRADAVLQDRLRSLPNVTVVTSAQTIEVIGDGMRVTGLSYRDRASGNGHHVALDGVFVQIGLVPNTEWLEGVVALTPRGEIEVDARGQTSAPGIVAAGDATTTPYKQIVVALGDGAKAALTAFDLLIRAAPAVLAKAA
ncbi:MAG: alkyl hydroperoxide reductase subunit F [Acetobacteraceae bacterium]